MREALWGLATVVIAVLLVALGGGPLVVAGAGGEPEIVFCEELEARVSETQPA